MNFYRLKNFLFLLFPLVFSFIRGSGFPEEFVKNDTLPVNQKDLGDVFRGILNGKNDKKSHERGSEGPFFVLVPAVGSSINTGITGVLAAGLSFFTNEERDKISSINLNANYSQYKQYWFTAFSNIYLENLKLHLTGDTRYYKFPTFTYGLGAESMMESSLRIDYSFLRINQLVYREIVPDLFLGAGIGFDNHWNIRIDSIRGSTYNQFAELQEDDQSISAGLLLSLLFDNRKNAVNPQGGMYSNLQYRTNYNFLGSDKKWQSLLIDLRKYFKLPAARSILALWSYNSFVLSGVPPYLDMPSIGWDNYSNTGRGYAPGRFTDRNLVYLESEYRFPVTRNDLLGAVVFANVESLAPTIPGLFHKFIPAGGLGLRIRVSKKSGTNLAIDYGFGAQGSRGFIFNIGEVF